MLVNLDYVATHWHQVLIVTALVVVGKGAITGAICAVLPCQARTGIVLAAGRGQIGEFSFILGQAGLQYALITDDQSRSSCGRDRVDHAQPVRDAARRPGQGWLQKRPGSGQADRGVNLPEPMNAALRIVVIVGCDVVRLFERRPHRHHAAHRRGRSDPRSTTAELPCRRSTATPAAELRQRRAFERGRRFTLPGQRRSPS
jgi:hypothetical protein